MPDLSTALELIDAFVAQRMAAVGSPGLALALTGRDQTIALRCYGLADTAARAPVTTDTLFEIGSIGKTFTAVALAQEAEAGRLDPRRPLRDYLPWLGLPEPRGPVAPHHLLCHTAGITAGPDFTPEARFQLLALRDLPPSSPPGARFHYSNLGYKALGLLLERLAGAPYPQVIAERILRPLGMDASAPAITAEIRPRLAVGYAPLYDDRPWHPSRPLLPAPFLETATADGCVAATAGDMAAFARALLGRGAPLLGEAGFGLLTSRAHPFDDQHAYGYGINVQQIDGRTHLWHHGGMPGFVAHLRCDLDSGLAAVALVNGPGAPTTICTFALACLRAALSGEPLPELPPPADRTRVERAAEYAGTFVWRGGGSGAPPDLTLEAESERLYLVRGGERVSLEPRGEDAFFAPHPELDGFLLQFGRDAAGRVVEAAHGLNWYAGRGYAGPTEFEHPPEWSAYPGRYRAHNPWVPSVCVALRKGRLHLIWTSDYDGAGGDEEPLVALPDGSFRVGEDEGGPERVRFDAVAEGQALRLTLSGSPMYRI